MTPELIVGLFCLALLGVVFVYWLTRRHEWREPDSRTTWEPSLDYLVREYHNLSTLDWLDLSDEEKITARNLYHEGITK